MPLAVTDFTGADAYPMPRRATARRLPHGTMTIRAALGGLRRRIGTVLQWLRATPPRPDRAAERLVRSWGELAPDIAHAMAAREAAGLLDVPETGFWDDVASVLDRRRSTGAR